MKDYFEEEQKQLLVMINADLKQQFNVKCIENRTTMSEVLRKHIEEYIENN